MAHITADRVLDTTTTTGTGNLTVSGTAPTGYRTFSAVCTTNDTFWYGIAQQSGSEWEVGLGTYSSANTIARTTVLASSNSNNAVNFSAGTKDIWIDLAASKTVQLDNSGNVTLSGNLTASVMIPSGSTAPTNGLYLPASNTIAWATNSTEALRVNANQYVGIGTTSPAAPLCLGNSKSLGWLNAAGSLNGTTTGTQILKFSDNSTYFDFLDSGSSLIFRRNGNAESGRFDGSGNFYFNSGYGSSAVAYGCRAWVNFNGTGVVAIRGSGNVTSITDNGVGDYTVNITNALVDANYSVALSAQYSTVGTNGRCLLVNASPTTSAIRIGFINVADNAFLDPVIYCVSVFR